MEAVQMKFASRKFVLATLGLLVSAVLLALGHIEPGNYVTIVGITVGGYMAANVWQKQGA